MLNVYYGSDAYRLHSAARAMTHSEIVDASSDDGTEKLERALKYPSFFDIQRCVVVRNASMPFVLEFVEQYDVPALTDLTLIAVQDTEDESYDKKILTKLIKLSSTSEQFEPLIGARRIAWLTEECKKLGATIEPKVAAVLSMRCKDSFFLANEMEKLVAYTCGAPITFSVVEALVPLSVEHDEWELSNALAALDKRAAIATLWRRLHEGMSEQLAIGSLAAGLRTLLMVKDLLDRHIPATSIAKTSGLHPFVVSKNAHGARTADARRLRTAHLTLTQLDRDAKNGRADATDGMFAVLCSL